MFKFKVFPKTFASFREGAGALYCDGGWTSISGSRLLCLHILPQSCTTSTSASIGFGGMGHWWAFTRQATTEKQPTMSPPSHHLLQSCTLQSFPPKFSPQILPRLNPLPHSVSCLNVIFSERPSPTTLFTQLLSLALFFLVALPMG